VEGHGFNRAVRSDKIAGFSPGVRQTLLMVFFSRKGKAWPISVRPQDYSPGDIVAWDLGGGVTHIGIVVDKKGASGHSMIVHNVGYGPKMEDELFSRKIIGHYRYYGPIA
jgi:uncharacterized protein